MRSYYKVVLALTLCQYCVFTCAQIAKKFFRNDYTYFNITESFYKIHTLHKSWQDALKMCAMEGASLFYPQDKKEADVMAAFLIRTQPFEWLYVGASDVFSKGVYETIDGEPVSNTYHNWGPGEPNDGHPQNCVTLRREGTLHDENCAIEYPFACKKTLSSLQWNKPCDMPFTDYEYNESTGRCYKFHLKPLRWAEAYVTCSAELSYLAVINSELEAKFLIKLAGRTSRDPAARDFVYLGFQNLIPGAGWRTIKGVPLSDSGYTRWRKGEPNNANEKCGSMYYNGELNDVECKELCHFICEHDVDPTEHI